MPRQRRGTRTLTLQEVADLVGGRVVGDAAIRVRRIAPLEDAREDELALYADRRYADALARTRGGAVLASSALAEQVQDRPAVVVADAHGALPTLLEHFHPSPPARPGVHPTAVIGAGVRLGEGVQVGAYAVLEDDCEVGDRAHIGPHCVIGSGARVGADALLHPHVVLYAGAQVGDRVILHSGVRVGSDGFGFVFAGGEFRKVPQVGGCIVEDDVEVGANTCIDRGSIGDTVVGRGSKLDNLVQIAHNVRLGPSCALAAQVGLAGSARVGRNVVFGGQSGTVGHVTVGDGVQVSAKAAITNDVPAGQTLGGFPARDIKEFMRASAVFLRLPEVLKRLRALESKVGVAGEG